MPAPAPSSAKVEGSGMARSSMASKVTRPVVLPGPGVKVRFSEVPLAVNVPMAYCPMPPAALVGLVLSSRVTVFEKESEAWVVPWEAVESLFHHWMMYCWPLVRPPMVRVRVELFAVSTTVERSVW